MAGANLCPNCGGSGSVNLPDDCGVCRGEGTHVHQWSCVCGARMSDMPPSDETIQDRRELG